MSPVQQVKIKGCVKGRVFIVGCARSGTTLLQALLAGHPEVASFPETHFFEKSLPGMSAHFSRGFRMYRILCEWIALNPDLNIPLCNVKRRWARKNMVHEFGLIMDRLTSCQGKSVWVEKTPGHIMHIDYIEKHFSEAVFIHIIRDGRAVIASLYDVTRKYPEAWGGARSLKQCIAEWNKRVTRSFDNIKKKNHFFVFYHNLTKQPELELRRVCSFLNLFYSPDMAGEFKESINRVAKENQPWMKQKQHKIIDEGYKKYFSVFAEEEKKIIERELLFPDIKKVEATFLKHVSPP